MNSQEHIAAALDFLALAEDSPVAQQNRLLRSELLWCAAAHAVKSVAKRRCWQNSSHDDLFDVAQRLSTTVDVRIRRWFYQASRLHRNMYEGDLSDRAIAQYRRQVRQMVHRLAGLVV